MKALRSLLLAVLCLLVPRIQVVAQQNGDCNALQKKFDKVNPSSQYGAYATSWAELQTLLGTPARVAEQQGSNPTLFYLLPGCSAQFTIDNQGLIHTKSFKLGVTALSGSPAVSARPSQYDLRVASTSSPAKQSSELTDVVLSLQASVRELQSEVSRLRNEVASLTQTKGSHDTNTQPTRSDAALAPVATGATSTDTAATVNCRTLESVYAVVGSTLKPLRCGEAVTVKEDLGKGLLRVRLADNTEASLLSRYVNLPGTQPAVDASTGNAQPTAAVSPVVPGCAENGSCYGDVSPTTGAPKTVHVDGYYRKDGTYVRGHYRSAPGSGSRGKK